MNKETARKIAQNPKKAPKLLSTLRMKIRTRFMCFIGMMRCSGYKVYPNGLRCPGCDDCKPIDGWL